MISNSEHYVSAADVGEGIPAPSSPQDRDMIVDAWRDALALVLADHDDNLQQQLRAVKAESMAAIAELRANAAEFRSLMEERVERRLAQIRQPADGPRGEQGERGERGLPGQLRAVKQFAEGGVHYEGDVVMHTGSTYQAQCDTAREPPHEDWICIARAGANGKDGRDGSSPTVRGTYSAGEGYAQLDIVALNGGSFIARRDDPGECPGSGWQSLTLPGTRGERGPCGERGPAGPAGPAIKCWKIDGERYQATPLMSDGSEGPTLELGLLFEQFHTALFERLLTEAR